MTINKQLLKILKSNAIIEKLSIYFSSELLYDISNRHATFDLRRRFYLQLLDNIPNSECNRNDLKELMKEIISLNKTTGDYKTYSKSTKVAEVINPWKEMYHKRFRASLKVQRVLTRINTYL